MKDSNISIKAMLGILLMIVSVFGRAEIVTVTYVHTDHLGSPTLLVDESGSVVHQMQYSPFGAHQGSPDIATGYTGHLEDEATDLTYMGARWYDPEVGRLLSPDPVRFSEEDLGTFHRYAYVANSPLGYTDPDGRAKKEIHPGQICPLEGTCRPIRGGGWARPPHRQADVASPSRSLPSGSMVSLPRRSVDDLVASSRPGRATSGRTTQYERQGGIKQANTDFDSLHPSAVRSIPQGRAGRLEDGRTVIVREHSTSGGRPTLEIQSGKSRIKFRFDD